MAVDRRAPGSDHGRDLASHVRAAVGGAPSGPALLAGVVDDPGDDRARDRRAGGAAVGIATSYNVAARRLRTGLHRSVGDPGEPLEPARQSHVSDRGGLPVDDRRGGDEVARDGRVRRRRSPRRRGRCARARPLQQPHGVRDRGLAARERPGRRVASTADRSRGVEATSSASGSVSSTSSSRRWLSLRRTLSGDLSVFLVLLVSLRALQVPSSEVMSSRRSPPGRWLAYSEVFRSRRVDRLIEVSLTAALIGLGATTPGSWRLCCVPVPDDCADAHTGQHRRSSTGGASSGMLLRRSRRAWRNGSAETTALLAPMLRPRSRRWQPLSAPCVLASERASHPGDEHHSAKPS